MNHSFYDTDSGEYSHAINELRFQEAFSISKSIEESNQKRLQEYFNEIISKTNDYTDYMVYTSNISKIELKRFENQKIQEFIQVFNEGFNDLKVRQEVELQNLKEKWVNDHDKAILGVQNRSNTLFYTSKVLASYNCFEEANELKRITEKNAEKNVIDGTKGVDEFYRALFESTITRHEQEQLSLFIKLENMIKSIRDSMEALESEISLQLNLRKAFTPVSNIRAIASSELSVQEKQILISQASPKKNRKQFAHDNVNDE